MLFQIGQEVIGLTGGRGRPLGEQILRTLIHVSGSFQSAGRFQRADIREKTKTGFITFPRSQWKPFFDLCLALLNASVQLVDVRPVFRQLLGVQLCQRS